LSFETQLRAAIESAPPSRLGDLSTAIWKAWSAQSLSDEAAQLLAEAVEARRTAARCVDPQPVQRRFPLRRPQRPPQRAVAIERRRRLAFSGPLPAALRARFTVGELAVLRIVGDEVRQRGACTRTLAEIAARAGVSRSLVQAALRRAAREGLLTVEERRRPGYRNLPNVVRVISPEWRTWIARGARSEGGGFKSFAPTEDKSSCSGSRSAQRHPSKGYPRDRVEPGGSRCASS
jgi:hypothetical protein